MTFFCSSLKFELKIRGDVRPFVLRAVGHVQVIIFFINTYVDFALLLAIYSQGLL